MTFATLDDRLDDEGVDVGENGEGLKQLQAETATDATEFIAAATTRLEKFASYSTLSTKESA